jgi:hypothetical protein
LNRQFIRLSIHEADDPKSSVTHAGGFLPKPNKRESIGSKKRYIVLQRCTLTYYENETKTEKLIIEPKRRSDLNDIDVRRKAKAAILWCLIATEHHAKINGEKPWRYVLVPHDEVQPNVTLDGLLSRFVQAPDVDLLSRYELKKV